MEAPDTVPTEPQQLQDPVEIAFPREVRLGDLLVCGGLITEAQLQEALEIQQKRATYRWIGQILVEQNAITQKQLNLFLDIYRKRPRLGDILVKSKAITPEQLTTALQHQKATGLPLGEILLKSSSTSPKRTSLLGVLAQRLVRKTCSECREQYTPSDELLREFFATPPRHIRWYKGRGCAQCNLMGYRGRLAVAELWIPNENDIILINKGAPFGEIMASSYNSTVSMAEDVKNKLYAGKTTLSVPADRTRARITPYGRTNQGFRKSSNHLRLFRSRHLQRERLENHRLSFAWWLRIRTSL